MSFSMTRIPSSSVRSNDDGCSSVQMDVSTASVDSIDDIDNGVDHARRISNSDTAGVQNCWLYCGKASDLSSVESNCLSMNSGDSGVVTTVLGDNRRLSFASSTSNVGSDYATVSMKLLTSPLKSEESSYLPSYMHRDPSERQRCLVCDDLASGIHYGIFTCEGCKGFFRRNVQHQMLGVFRYACKLEGTCSVVWTNRTACQACRFKKCIEAGMKRASVLTIAEREAKQKKIQQNRKQKGVNKPDDTGKSTNEFCLQSVIRDACKRRFPSLCSTTPQHHESQAVNPADHVDSLLASFIGRRLKLDAIDNMRSFIAELPGAQLLSQEVHCNILRSGVARLYCLDLAVGYNAEADCIAFTSDSIVCGIDVPEESVSCLVFRLGRSLKRLQLDSTELALIAAAATVRPSDHTQGAVTVNERLTQFELFDRIIDALHRNVTNKLHRTPMCIATALEIVEQLITVADELENIQLLMTPSSVLQPPIKVRMLERHQGDNPDIAKTRPDNEGLCFLPNRRAVLVMSH